MKEDREGEAGRKARRKEEGAGRLAGNERELDEAEEGKGRENWSTGLENGGKEREKAKKLDDKESVKNGACEIVKERQGEGTKR